tara:strand:- start:1266 stop:1694 length:429 start_codon:yes stop_codon:yes gene_type:complete
MLKRLMNFCKEGGCVLSLIVFLLLSNILVTVIVSDNINKNLHQKDMALKLLIEMELKKKTDNEKFRSNIYQAFSMLMSGQSQLAVNQERLNIDILRIHHFVKPHVKFYPACPECQEDKKHILDEESPVTKHPRQDSNLQPTD